MALTGIQEPRGKSQHLRKAAHVWIFLNRRQRKTTPLPVTQCGPGVASESKAVIS